MLCLEENKYWCVDMERLDLCLMNTLLHFIVIGDLLVLFVKKTTILIHHVFSSHLGRQRVLCSIKRFRSYCSCH